MTHFTKKLLIAISVIMMCVSCTEQTLTSPDKRTKLTFSLTKEGPVYSVIKDKQTIILPSRLGFDEHTYTFLSATTTSHDERWQQVWGEEIFVRNHYNELAVVLSDETDHELTIRFRAFDDGIAFRYEFGGNGEFTIKNELTEYHFVEDAVAWSIPWDAPYYEALWTSAHLSEKEEMMSSPITLEMSNGTYGFLHEANLTDWPAQNFKAQKTEQGVLLSTYLTPWSDGTSVYGQYGTTRSSWRMLVLADDINALATSRLMLNLNEPCVLDDTSWIQPQKFIGIWWGMHLDLYTWHQGKQHGATTKNMKRYIDFASQHGFNGILCEGWNYGWDGDWSGEGYRFSFTQPYPDFDIDYLSEYAKQKGVQIIGHHETGGWTQNYESQIDSAYSFYNRHNVSVVKTGYVGLLDGKEIHKSQYGVRHMRRVIETAARYHICIDNHEPVMPTGLQRTYPNLMTQEGVRGQEWDAWSTDGGSPANHLCILPFTRILAGPVDFTPGTFNFSNPVHPNTRVHSTLARQLALFVVIYSPLQMASDLPENYELYPDAFRFIEQVPCDWQHTQIVDAKIGEYVVTARQDKASTDWYVGAITNDEKRQISFPTDFLETGCRYTVELYADGQNCDWKENPYDISISELTIEAGDTINLQLAECGGAALRFVKQE
ncbi:MAG: glycoside hydrolase family 97 protein [Paludibacteraceae bacterium]|nr:glycoside hydrolase family 97 protein [Paludibacteraceae bacterium]